MVLECAKDSVATSYGDLGDGYNGADAGFTMNPHISNNSRLESEEIDSDIGY